MKLRKRDVILRYLKTSPPLALELCVFPNIFFLEITNLKKIIIHCLFLKCQGNFAKYHLVSFRKVPYNVCNGQESNPICLVLGCPNKLCTPVVSSGVRSVFSIVFEVRSEGPFFHFSSGHAKQDGGQRTLILNVRLQCCFW